MRVRVVRLEAHRLAERGDAPVVVAGLDEHETEVVVGFGEVGPEPDGFAELGRHLAAVGALAAEQEAEHVAAPRRGPGSRRAPCGGRRSRTSQSGAGTPGRGEVQPGLELSQRLVEIARPQVGDAEVHVDGGGGRQERDRALQARPGSRPGRPSRAARSRGTRGRRRRRDRARRSSAARPGPGRGSRCTRGRRRGCSGPRRTRAGAPTARSRWARAWAGLPAGRGRSPGGCARPRGSRPGGGPR